MPLSALLGGKVTFYLNKSILRYFHATEDSHPPCRQLIRFNKLIEFKKYLSKGEWPIFYGQILTPTKAVVNIKINEILLV